jgi:hypothetical protein
MLLAAAAISGSDLCGVQAVDGAFGGLRVVLFCFERVIVCPS